MTAEDAFELEYSEDDISYYIVDEDDNEIGFALAGEDGNVIEYYYADESTGEDDGEDDALAASATDGDGTFELEYSERDVAYYIEDEEGTEIGLALSEPDGTTTEYYYEGVDVDALEPAARNTSPAASAQQEAPVGSEPFAQRAGSEVGRFAARAEEQAAKTAAAAKVAARRIKDGASSEQSEEADEDLGFGITAGTVKRAASSLSAMAKEGAQTAAELKEAYDDIFEGIDFLKPSTTRRIRRR